MTNLIFKLAAVLLSFPFLSFCETTLSQAIKTLQNGQYQKAEHLLTKLIHETGNPVEKAKAFRHLGTVRHKLNHDHRMWEKEFDKSIEILEDSPSSAEELSLTRFQKANCLINTAFIKIREKRLSGINSNALFRLLKDYLSPAQNTLKKVEPNYPPQLKADLLLLKADITLLIQLICHDSLQKKDYKRFVELYQKAYQYELKNNPSPRNDLLLSTLLRQATLYRQAGEKLKASVITEKSINIKSENRELNLEARLQYATVKLSLIDKKEEFRQLEELLLKAIKEIEMMRLLNMFKQHYFLPKLYFSKRLSAYELLLEVYSRQGKTTEMLSVIDQMKARAFKGVISQKNTFYPELNIKLIQQQLQAKHAIAVEYFLGAEKSRLFIITPTSISCKSIKSSGAHIVSLTNSLLSGYTDTSLLRHYKSTGSNTEKYQQLLKTYEAAEELYNLLISPLDSLSSKAGNVYIIPHCVTNYLPFSALVKELNRENLLKSVFFAENSAPLTFLPSLSLLGNTLSERFTGRSKVFYRTKFNNGFYNLPKSEKEAETIAEIIDGKLYFENEFIKPEIVENHSIDILYLASHINNRPLNPDDHAVVLSSDSSANLSVKELILNFRNQIKTNLTVLSLCQTNFGEKIPIIGDDLSNLSRAFLIAGSKSVLTSQWVVTDDHTPQILKNMTINYTKGCTPAQALNKAIKDYLKTVESTFYRHPFYWGNLLILQKGIVK